MGDYTISALQLDKQLEMLEAAKARKAARELQEAKLRALQDALSNYGNFRYVDLEDFIDPDNQNWKEYKYYAPDPSTYLMGPPTQGYINAGTPVGEFIDHIRHAETIDDVKKQLELWDSYKPLDSSDNGINYIRNFIPRFAMHVTTPDGSNPAQTTAGGTGGAQGAVAVGSTQGSQAGNTGGGTPSAQGVQAGAKTGGTGGMQAGNSGGTGGAQAGGTGSGTSGTQGMKTGGTGGTLASAGVPRGGTKTIGYGYDPNPGNVSLAYVMRNAPEQERRDALINKWNRENGRESVPYVPGTEIPAGSLNRSSSTYASPGVSSGGTYATGEGIKDANGNVLTNPGGDWEYQYALKNPQYGLGMMSKMSDAQRNYLQAVSNDMGYNYNFTGAPRYV